MQSLDVWAAGSSYPSWYPNTGIVFDGKYYDYDSSRAMLKSTVPEKQSRDRINILGKVIITPLKGLSITGEYLFNKYIDNLQSFDKIVSLLDPMTNAPKLSGQFDTYQKTFASTKHHSFNAYATYETIFSKKHYLKLMAGYNEEYDFYEQLTTSRLNAINPDLPSIGGSVGTIAASDGFSEYALRGSFFRVNYALKDRYLFEVNGRYDGSSKFPKNDRFGFFPSVSVGWRVSEENFMKNINSIINNLKIRGSWGSVGNQAINPYLYLETLTPALVDWVGDNLRKTSLGTPSLVRANFTWEKAITGNIGVDLGLLEGKINFVFDKYWRETRDMLGPGVDYPTMIGASSPLQNSADLVNSGYELSLSWRDKIGEVSYGLSFNLSDSQTKITKFKNDTKILSSNYEGKGWGEIWGYETDRLYTIDDFVDGSLKTSSSGILSGGTLKPGIGKVEGTNPNPGDVLYKNPDENGLIRNGKNTLDDHGSLRIIGNNSPRYLYGFSGDISWKGFSFSILLQGVAKRDLWLGTDNNLIWPLSGAQLTSLYTNELDYWTPENPQAHFARFYVRNGINTNSNRLVQTRYLQNASYLDIKNVTLTYKLPKSMISGIGLSDMSMFVGCENPWSFNHLPNGLHPESVIRSGGTVYPIMRMFSTGINISF
jgi:TonB-linked SusC/RagA family outer membrane protein